jgi:outer membrane protein OmpA-like peptidoglycan-associated protein
MKKSILILIITLLGVNIAYTQKIPKPIPELVNNETRYGLFFDVNLNQHSADFMGSQLPFPSCCPQFTDGSGVAFSIGLLFELPIAENLFFGLRAGYHDLSGELVTEEHETVYDYTNNTETTGIFEHTINANISTIGIQPMLNYRLWEDLFVHLGMRLDFVNLDAQYDHVERILEPERGRYDNGMRQRAIAQFTDIENKSSVHLAALAGISYEFFLDKQKELIIAPELFYHYMFTDIVDQDDFAWKIHSIMAGLSIKYAPFPKSTKPAEQSKTSLLSGTIAASSIGQDGVESKIVTLQVEEFLSTNMKPLLTYVFFDESSSTLPERYNQINKSQTADFSIDKLYPLNNIETYYHVLNIIGKRMIDNPDAKIALDGCNSDTGPEKDNQTLSQRRAETVKNYLVNNWGIESDRIIVNKRNLPQEPTNIREADGIQENRRVEITSNKWEIIAPIISNDTFRVSTPPTVRFRTSFNSEAGIKGYNVRSLQSGKELALFSNLGDPPNVIDWRLSQEKDNFPRTEELLDYELILEDNQGNSYTTDKQSLPVNQVTVQKKRREKIQDKYIDRFSLILFSYDESKLSYYNARMGDIMRSVVKPTSLVKISGHTDRLGADDYNQKLSDQRAAVVKSYLTPKNSIVKGFGENDMVYDNNLPEGRFYSRRVDIIVETPIEDK